MCRVRRVWQLLIIPVLAASGCGQKPAPVVDLASERQRMVQEQLMPRGIHEERVLAAMKKVPREEFAPQETRAAGYTDQPLPIGYGQTISQPFVVAFMTEQLQLKRDDRVLEIGTGSGYRATIIKVGRIARHSMRSSSRARQTTFHSRLSTK